jgi:hypothetical protein
MIRKNWESDLYTHILASLKKRVKAIPNNCNEEVLTELIQV